MFKYLAHCRGKLNEHICNVGVQNPVCLLAGPGMRAHQNLDVLISILYKFVEAFGYDVVDMDLARDHGLEVLEPASKTRQRQKVN